MFPKVLYNLTMANEVDEYGKRKRGYGQKGEAADEGIAVEKWRVDNNKACQDQ